jgi:hypothetical protein
LLHQVITTPMLGPKIHIEIHWAGASSDEQGAFAVFLSSSGPKLSGNVSSGSTWYSKVNQFWYFPSRKSLSKIVCGSPV